MKTISFGQGKTLLGCEGAFHPLSVHWWVCISFFCPRHLLCLLDRFCSWTRPYAKLFSRWNFAIIRFLRALFGIEKDVAVQQQTLCYMSWHGNRIRSAHCTHLLQDFVSREHRVYMHAYHGVFHCLFFFRRIKFRYVRRLFIRRSRGRRIPLIRVDPRGRALVTTRVDRIKIAMIKFRAFLRLCRRSRGREFPTITVDPIVPVTPTAQQFRGDLTNAILQHPEKLGVHLFTNAVVQKLYIKATFCRKRRFSFRPNTYVCVHS